MDFIILYGIPSLIILVLYWFGIRPLLRHFNLMETQAITNNLFCIKTGFSQVYVYKTDTSLLCFDAGNLSSEELAKEFEKVNLNPEEVSAVFLTHSDSDHIKGLDLFEDPTIYVSKRELDIDPATTKFFRKNRSLPEGKTIEPVQDQQELQIDETSIKVVSMPGHTVGSLGFVVNGSIFIAGDAINIHHEKLFTAPSFINDDTPTAQQSLKKLQEYPNLEIICTGHSGFLATDVKAVIKSLK